LAHNYALTIEGYNILFVVQNGCCAICGDHQNNMKRKLSVDHNHITGEVRGLLCHKCNVAIGLMKDNVDTLANAIKYLLKK
jgi:hypothetical protein